MYIYILNIPQQLTININIKLPNLIKYRLVQSFTIFNSYINVTPHKLTDSFF